MHPPHGMMAQDDGIGVDPIGGQVQEEREFRRACLVGNPSEGDQCVASTQEGVKPLMVRGQENGIVAPRREDGRQHHAVEAE